MDIDAPLLRDLKRLQKREGPVARTAGLRPAGRGSGRARGSRPEPPAFEWRSRPMAARIDLADKDAVQAALDRELPAGARREGRS